jgi:cytochrome c7-like protein
MHEKVNCTQCHVKPVFTNVGKNCQDCHADIHQRQMGTDCAQCHTVQGWNIAVQQVKDHQNRFPLLGAHAAVQCDECHKSAAVGQFQGLSTACASCHLQDFQRTTNPNHVSAQFPTTCETCHSFDSWLGAKNFNHSAPPINFPLTNGHANVPCASCHINNNYNLTTTLMDCGNSGCHLTKWQQTNNPVHPSAGPAFAVGNCSGCHNTVSWTTAVFDHSTTGFLLTNGHANVPCTSCHINNNYNLTIAPTDCGNSGCHLTKWQQTNNPVHPSAGPAFAVGNCSGCHNTVSWTTAIFDHSTTGFLLTNGHANVPCASCHTTNNYNLTIAPTDCGNSGCHLTRWQQTTTPVHSTSGPAFAATNCANCHTTNGWTAAAFDHSVTGFTLTGTHVSPTPTPCASCHVSNNYTLNSADCMGCHQPDWNKTPTYGGSVPDHIKAGFPSSASACATCHPITKWADGKFDHNAFGFPLTNSHALAANGGKVPACVSCHINNNYNLAIAPTDCGNSGCHFTTWQQTNNPVHPSAGAPFAAANCSTCHNTITWTTAIFNHAATGWALTGSHQMVPAGKVVACTDCHTGNNYTFTAANTDCMGCHTTAWQSTTTIGGAVPNHIAAGFPTSLCSTCHDTVLWVDGKFDHSTTGWPLQGTHVTTPCASCHIGNKYNLTMTDCYTSGCHVAAWLSTQTLGGQVPNHIAAQFPTTCVTCHTTWVTTGWLGATLSPAQHTWFRIPHHGSVCSDCHLVSTDYATFSCENCHTSSNAHRPGMSHPNVCSPSPACWYNPPSRCYDCHKQ